MMKFFLVLISLTCFRFGGSCQSNILLTASELEGRIAKGSDTIYVINFWATWCGPCVKELPHFEKLQSVYKTEKVKVLLVSVDFRSQLKTKVMPFIAKRRFKSEVYLLDENDQQAYIEKIDPGWSGAIPATLFIKGGIRKFTETEFTFNELKTAYLNFKKS